MIRITELLRAPYQKETAVPNVEAVTDVSKLSNVELVRLTMKYASRMNITSLQERTLRLTLAAELGRRI